MWNLAKILDKAHDGHRRGNWRKANQKHGFSHPARFEALEPRLSLNVAPGTTASGNVPGGPLGANGVVELPGTASITNGTNPANLASFNADGGVDLSGTAGGQDATAFANPSWIPNDRPQNPMTTPPNDGLPNIYQEAATPYGIRNFNIGANTGLRHRDNTGISVVIPTVRGPTEAKTAMIELVPTATDLSPWIAGGKKATSVPPKPAELTQQQSEPGPQDNEQRENATLPLLAAELTDERLEIASPTKQAAVDRTMEDQVREDAALVDASLTQLVAEESPADPIDAGDSVLAIAASVGVVTSAGGTRDPNWKTRPDDWRKKEARTRRLTARG